MCAFSPGDVYGGGNIPPPRAGQPLLLWALGIQTSFANGWIFWAESNSLLLGHGDGPQLAQHRQHQRLFSSPAAHLHGGAPFRIRFPQLSAAGLQVCLCTSKEQRYYTEAKKVKNTIL